MADEEPKGFFKRVLGRFGGKPEASEQPQTADAQTPAEFTPAKPEKKPKKQAYKPDDAADESAKTETASTKETDKPVEKKTKKAKSPAKPKARTKPEVKPAPEAKSEAAPVPVQPVDKAPQSVGTPEPKTASEPEVDEASQPSALEPAIPEPTAPESAPKKRGWFSRLKDGLTRSSSQLTENIAAVFTKRKLDDEALQDLEDILIQADLGVETAMTITEEVAKGRFDKEISDHEIREILGAEVARVLSSVATPLEVDDANQPHIILVVGVNGTGKTTTIGKLAAKFRDEGKSVMLAAGDTFRAAAIDQLKIWGERVGAGVVARDVGADASGLVYDAITQAREAKTDILLIDTAGRLQNQANLMDELEKVRRVIGKQIESAPHDVLLVLDATTGQNALQQVEIFRRVAGVTGLVMTKLDGTARGGILVAIAAKYQLPVHAIGVGETVDDLQPFEADQFANAIAGLEEETA